MGCVLFPIGQVVMLELGRRSGPGKAGLGLDPKSSFCAAIDKDRTQMRRAKPNKPKGLKRLVINNIAREGEKQTHEDYQPWYQ